jgi:hypothetical protein
MAWAKVQSFAVSTQFNSTGAASTAVTLGSAVAVGSTINVITTYGGADLGATPTLTDQLGNTYTRQTACHARDVSNSQQIDGWCCIVTSAGTPTITFDPNGANVTAFIGFMGDHFTGSDAASVVEGSAGQFQNNPGTGSNPDVITSGNTAATTTDGDLVWGGSQNTSTGTTTEAIGTGFAAGHALDTTSDLITDFKTQATHGVTAATFIDATNGGSANFVTCCIAVKPVATGAGLSPAPPWGDARTGYNQMTQLRM